MTDLTQQQQQHHSLPGFNMLSAQNMRNISTSFLVPIVRGNKILIPNTNLSLDLTKPIISPKHRSSKPNGYFIPTRVQGELINVCEENNNVVFRKKEPSHQKGTENIKKRTEFANQNISEDLLNLINFNNNLKKIKVKPASRLLMLDSMLNEYARKFFSKVGCKRRRDDDVGRSGSLTKKRKFE